jgi:hypothetical protein
MASVAKENKKALTTENLDQLQKFIEKVKKGEITPLQEKTERARKNLKRAGLI